MEQWEKNYYISSIAGANNGSSLVVMSKGLFFTMSILLFDGFMLRVAFVCYLSFLVLMVNEFPLGCKFFLGRMPTLS